MFIINQLIALALLVPTPTPHTVPVARDGSTSVILIGDTGEPGPIVGHWTEALRQDPSKSVIVLGDLIYPQAPPCPTGRPDREAVALIESHLAAPFRTIGKPAYLVIGNHDVSWGDDPARERCLLAHFSADPLIKLPELFYTIEAGAARIVVLHTMGLGGELGERQGRFAKAQLDEARGQGRRVVLIGHHVLRTYRDKDSEDIVRPWLEAHDLRPDLWVNGHAHILQLGVYGGIPALTSGSASRPRVRAECDAARGTGSCGEGELWGVSTPGYAVLDVTPRRVGAPFMKVTFKDADGHPLFAWDVPPQTEERRR